VLVDAEGAGGDRRPAGGDPPELVGRARRRSGQVEGVDDRLAGLRVDEGMADRALRRTEAGELDGVRARRGDQGQGFRQTPVVGLRLVEPALEAGDLARQTVALGAQAPRFATQTRLLVDAPQGHGEEKGRGDRQPAR